MSKFNVTPKNLLLGVFHTGKQQAIPIKAITHIGELFGFTSNTMRVNVTRLLSAEVLEQDERGYYRLNTQSFNDKTTLVAKLINQWRLGEQRRIDWNKTWLMACLPNKKSITSNKDNIKALGYLGFATSNSFQWVRPNNLSYSWQTHWDYLIRLGLTNEAQLFVITETDPATIHHWENKLWPVSDYQKHYQALLTALKKSKQAIKKMSLDRAAVETFSLGSEVVNTLATDPLLPEELMHSNAREKLTDAMLEYDAIGKEIWNSMMGLDTSHLPYYAT